MFYEEINCDQITFSYNRISLNNTFRNNENEKFDIN